MTSGEIVVSIMVGVALFLITGIIGYTAKNIIEGLEDHKAEHKQLKENTQLLMKSQILDIYNRGKMKGHLGEHEKDVANELFVAYQKSGGNGYMEGIITKINNNF